MYVFRIRSARRKDERSSRSDAYCRNSMPEESSLPPVFALASVVGETFRERLITRKRNSEIPTSSRRIAIKISNTVKDDIVNFANDQSADGNSESSRRSISIIRWLARSSREVRRTHVKCDRPT